MKAFAMSAFPVRVGWMPSRLKMPPRNVFVRSGVPSPVRSIPVVAIWSKSANASTTMILMPRAAETSAAAAAISALNAWTFARACARSTADRTSEQGGVCSSSVPIESRSSGATGSSVPSPRRHCVTSPAARRSTPIAVTSGRFPTAMSTPASASRSRSWRYSCPNSATGRSMRVGSVLVPMERMSLLPIHTRRYVGRSSSARDTWLTDSSRMGSPRIRNLRMSRPSGAPETSCWASSSGSIPSKIDSMSSPGTARLRTRFSGSARKPMPSTRRSISPGSSTPSLSSSSIRYWGGTPGRSMRGCGRRTRAWRAMSAGALCFWPAGPFSTKPPEA